MYMFCFDQLSFKTGLMSKKPIIWLFDQPIILIFYNISCDILSVKRESPGIVRKYKKSG
tara:strand:+ start:909 stop:1085 length:177 start_codon:yes stop_codon:yes gene_type:complete